MWKVLCRQKWFKGSYSCCAFNWRSSPMPFMWYNVRHFEIHYTIWKKNANRKNEKFISFRFKTKTNLQKHIKRHRDVRPFVCEISVCKKSFRTKCDLDIHLRVHSGAKPFTCDVCSKSFRTIGTYRVRYLNHTITK